MQWLPILTYHAIADHPAPTAVSPGRFGEQMAALAGGGYQAVTLSCLLEGLRKPRAEGLAERYVAITFDDGYRSVLAVAAPILREHGFTATVFLVTGCGEPEAAWRPQWPLLTWDEVEALSAAGFELGAHTATHPVLTRLAPAEAEREMFESQQEIAGRTGQAARVLAYPYGARSQAVEAIARRRFDAACGTRLGLASPASNQYDLERVDAYYLNPAGLAARLAAAPTRLYLGIRRGLRWVRRLARPDWHNAAAPGNR